MTKTAATKTTTTKTDALFPHIVIRASAGTGKTFQLSNRFLGLTAAGYPPDHILAATFARKAAGEILDRVLLRLAEAADDPKKLAELERDLKLPGFDAPQCVKILRQLIDRLHRLQISTLDSFFIQMASSFSLELGLPPGWRIVESIEDEQIRYEAIQQVLHDNPLSDSAELVRLLGKGEASRSITEEIAEIVKDLYEVFRDTAATPDVWQKLPHAKELDAAGLREALAQLESLPQLDGKLLNKARASDGQKAAAGDWAGFVSAGLARPLLAGEQTYSRQEIPPAFAAAYRPLLDHARAVLVNQLVHQTQGTGRLLARFDAAYQPLKLTRRALRFDDVTHYLSAALADGRLQDVGYRLDAGIAHLLLDEFQDTSLAQWSVLRPFAKRVTIPDHKGSLFCVGDVKQAIYGWRGGIAELLNAVGSELPGLKEESLTKSYRSAPVVIDTVNRVFSSLATNGALGDFSRATTVWGEQFTEHSTVRTAFPGQCRLLTAPAAEGRRNSKDQQIATLEYAAAVVARNAAEHPGRTIGVLVRRNKAVNRLIYELRERHELFASQEGGNPLTDSPAVELVLSLLAMADHPGDTVARFHVAHSPLGKAIGFTDHADSAAAQRLATALRDSLLADGYGPTIYGWVKSLAPECGRRDVSRLLQLVEMAYTFDDGKIRRPDEFLRQARERSVEDPMAAPIRVMTVHQSKGLQFDIVVLPQLDEPLVGQPPKLVVGRDSPTGPIQRVCRYANEQLQKLLPSEFQQIFTDRTQQVVSESLCLLYVAMTRAVYALDMVVAPQHADKLKGSATTSWPKTFAGILLSALGAGDDVPPESGIFQLGDPRWSTKTPAADAVSPEAMPAAKAVELETLGVTLRASSAVRRRGLDRRSPSKLEGGTKVDLTQRLRLESAAGMARGTLVHAWLEHVDWLENGVPDEATLRQTAAPLADPRIEVAGELDRFKQLLGRPAAVSALSQSTYRDPAALGLPAEIAAEIAAGLMNGDVHMKLHREWPFAVRLDDSIVQGFVDRLLLYYRADKVIGDKVSANSVVAADILDFKTDAVEVGEAVDQRVEYYRPQLEAYRRAVAEVYRLDPRKIAARLLFLDPGVIKKVSGTKFSSGS